MIHRASYIRQLVIIGLFLKGGPDYASADDNKRLYYGIGHTEWLAQWRLKSAIHTYTGSSLSQLSV